MKLLFDQNLSHRLCKALGDIFPGSGQVKALRLDRATDEMIWTFARRGGFAIVTLDADFAEMAALRGAPPKVIWLRCGNRSTVFMDRLMRARANAILSFAADADAACLELYGTD